MTTRQLGSLTASLMKYFVGELVSLLSIRQDIIKKKDLINTIRNYTQIRIKWASSSFSHNISINGFYETVFFYHFYGYFC